MSAWRLVGSGALFAAASLGGLGLGVWAGARTGNQLDALLGLGLGVVLGGVVVVRNLMREG